MGTLRGIWLSSRCSFSLLSYSASSPAWRRLAMWISPSWLASSMNLSALSSGSCSPA